MTTRKTGGLHKPSYKGVILAAPKSAPEKLHLSDTYYLKSSSDELLVPESRRYTNRICSYLFHSHLTVCA
jgi:hypothetical protein